MTTTTPKEPTTYECHYHEGQHQLTSVGRSETRFGDIYECTCGLVVIMPDMIAKRARPLRIAAVLKELT